MGLFLTRVSLIDPMPEMDHCDQSGLSALLLVYRDERTDIIKRSSACPNMPNVEESIPPRTRANLLMARRSQMPSRLSALS
jgi:hypothetical protein